MVASLKDPPPASILNPARIGQTIEGGGRDMLSREQYDLLTQTGPGTPGGRLFRCYWMPALLAGELPENDCHPVRVKILSERLIAFRFFFQAEDGIRDA